MNETLQGFADRYRREGLPPPHILLTGKDDARNASVAQDFARALGVGMTALNCADISTQGDLTALLTNRNVALLNGVQSLSRPYLDWLVKSLETGELKINIGTGPAARIHFMDMVAPALIVTCPAKFECPASLLKHLKCVIPIEPYTDRELQKVLEREAYKSRISFGPGAAELMVRAGNGLSSVMLHRFNKVIGQIEQVKQTNMPVLSVSEIANALAKLRIEIPHPVSAATSRTIDQLSGQEFERLIKALLIEMGFQAELTEVTGDGGIDIIAQLDRPFSGGKYLFQCKRYAQDNIIGSPAVRDFYGAVMADRAVKGIFITTSDFSAQAREFAAQTGIELVNRGKLTELLDEFGVLPS